MARKCLNEVELIELALRRTKKARNQTLAAKMLGVGRSHYVGFITGHKRPGPRILRRLGMTQHFHYEKKVARRAKKTSPVK